MSTGSGLFSSFSGRTPGRDAEDEEIFEVDTPPEVRGTTTAVIYTIPVVGGLDAHGPWVGGEPNGIDRKGSKLSKPATVYCYRVPSLDYRSYLKRVQGLTQKLKYDSKDGISLPNFTANVMRHVKMFGMDSVFYIPDPAINKLVNIVLNHNKYNVQDILREMAKYSLQGSYDDYDQRNLVDSAEFLLNSIDEVMSQQIGPFITHESTGPEIWMRIVGELQSSSSDRLLTVVEKVKRLKVQDFKGQDVKKFSAEMMTYCTDLQLGGSLPREICVTIVEAFLNTTVERFRMEFYAIRPTIMAEFKRFNGHTQD